MPATSSKQANAAKLAGAVKAGKFPASKAGDAVKSMSKMPMDKLKHFMKVKESLSLEDKKKLLKALKLAKECKSCGCGVTEDIIDTTERNAIAKEFNVDGDFDAYINRHRGIEMTPKEQQAILGYRQKPTQSDKFLVKYEKTDDWGNNSTTVIKKLKEGNQFCWVAFAKNENDNVEEKPEAAPEPSPKGGGDEMPMQEAMPMPSKPSTPSGAKPTPTAKPTGKPAPAKAATPKPAMPATPVEEPEPPIRIVKTITFTDDIKGADILSDLLNSGKLDL